MNSRAKNKYFYDEVASFHQFLIGNSKTCLEVGAGSGDLLSHLKPSSAVAVDFSSPMVQHIRSHYPAMTAIEGRCENLDQLDAVGSKTFDYIIANGLLSFVPDVQLALRGMAKICKPETRIILSTYNAFWEPLLRLGAALGLRATTPLHNWLNDTDLENLLFVEDLEIVSKYSRILMPKYIPLVSWLLNRIFIHIPGLRQLCLMKYFVLRKRFTEKQPLTSSIVIPARNEAGNIESAVIRIPQFGSDQEIIFVEGNSTDNTWEEIERVRLKYPEKRITTLRQPGKGKGDAVRHGFSHASGDVLFILDADLTVPPEDLPKFYDCLVSGKAEFVNGTRLVYPMEKEAMRFLNLLGNKFFAWAFSWLLSQKFKDTLCGTKVLRRQHYEKIAANRTFFGDFDPFGDFDLLFGAAKQNLKIVEIPIRYKERTYGETNISRFRHGWLLLQMCAYAARKIKFV
ncbi:MAG: glycosyltransferase [Oligoflexia bacterium]|nr:glycosyltransferase [Oligoflexia bacterium]